MEEDLDYQTIEMLNNRQNFNVMEEKIEELEELIDTLTKRIEALEKLVNFHEAIRRR